MDSFDILRVDWLSTMWTTYTFVMFFVGIPVAYFPSHIPPFLVRLSGYGKMDAAAATKSAKKDEESYRGIWKYIRLPKRAFTHFYIFASVYGSLAAVILFVAYYYLSVPNQVILFLNILGSSQRDSNVEPVAVIVVMILLLVHIYQRAYECLFISVISGYMNVFHYIVGITFYFGCVTSLLAEAPGFTDEGFDLELFQEISWKWYQVLGTALYFWALWHQYHCSTILASLRKDSKGIVISSGHKIPDGDWFNYVSCPHFLAEILMYFAMNLILNFDNTLWLQVLGWVFVNQTIMAILNHQWLTLAKANDTRRGLNTVQYSAVSPKEPDGRGKKSSSVV